MFYKSISSKYSNTLKSIWMSTYIDTYVCMCMHSLIFIAKHFYIITIFGSKFKTISNEYELQNCT